MRFAVRSNKAVSIGIIDIKGYNVSLAESVKRISSILGVDDAALCVACFNAVYKNIRYDRDIVNALVSEQQR